MTLGKQTQSTPKFSLGSARTYREARQRLYRWKQRVRKQILDSVSAGKSIDGTLKQQRQKRRQNTVEKITTKGSGWVAGGITIDVFNELVDDIGAGIEEMATRVYQSYGIDILLKVSAATPYVTGNLRNNWVVGINNLPGGTYENIDHLRAEVQKIAGASKFEQIYIVNNAVYLPSVDAKHGGFIGRAVDEVNDYYNEETVERIALGGDSDLYSSQGVLDHLGVRDWMAATQEHVNRSTIPGSHVSTQPAPRRRGFSYSNFGGTGWFRRKGKNAPGLSSSSKDAVRAWLKARKEGSASPGFTAKQRAELKNYFQITSPSRTFNKARSQKGTSNKIDHKFLSSRKNDGRT